MFTFVGFWGGPIYGEAFFAYNWKLPTYNGFFTYILVFFFFLLIVGPFPLAILVFYLQLELFRLQWKSATNKHLNGL